MLVWAFLSVAAAGGYGDAVEGYPDLGERTLHLWTNAARVDPEAFEDAYQSGGCSFEDFSSDEQTPKHPLLWNFDLNEAARYHSTDMYENDWFDHASSDGTSFEDRMARYYESGFVGENIAYGYGDPFNTVMGGWMCSTSGHRANIMSGDWDELGTGWVNGYATQDFGARGVDLRGTTMAIHEVSGTEVTFRADSWDADDVAPDEVIVVLDGLPHELALEYGEPFRGIWVSDAIATDETACHQYFTQLTWGDTRVRFPETGSYGWGACDWDDEGAGWLATQLGISGRDDLTEDQIQDSFTLIGGCNTAPGPLAGAWLGVLALLRRRSAR